MEKIHARSSISASTVALACCLLLVGCQTAPVPVPGAVDQTDFHGQWGAYRACMVSMTLEAAGLAIRHLDRAPVRDVMPPDLLPGALRRVAEKPPVRLAADPKALAAACVVHAGHLALAEGERELAAEWFALVITRYPESDYASYVTRAMAGLSHITPEITTASARPFAFTR
jgi:hypothetical protein